MRGSHFFTENGSEIGRFRQPGGPLRRHGRRRRRTANSEGRRATPVIRSTSGTGDMVSGCRVAAWMLPTTSPPAIATARFVFRRQQPHHQSTAAPQERNNPLTKGTPWERMDVFAGGEPQGREPGPRPAWLPTVSVPFHILARCVGLASLIGLRGARGIDRTEFVVTHDKRNLVEDCRFVGNCAVTTSPTPPASPTCGRRNSSAATGPGAAWTVWHRRRQPHSRVPAAGGRDDRRLPDGAARCLRRGNHVIRGGSIERVSACGPSPGGRQARSRRGREVRHHEVRSHTTSSSGKTPWTG